MKRGIADFGARFRCATPPLACLRVGAGYTVPELIRKRAPIIFLTGQKMETRQWNDLSRWLRLKT